MRAIGDLQQIEGGELITDMEAFAQMCSLVWTDIAVLIEVGVTAGYLEDDAAGGVGLAAKGQRWYERDLLRRE